MRTGRSLTVCWRLLPGGVWFRGGLVPGGSGPWGSWVPGGLVPGGCLLPGGVSGPGGVSSRGGVCSQGGIPACTEGDPPPVWTESQTPVTTLPWPNFVAAGKNLHHLHFFFILLVGWKHTRLSWYCCWLEGYNTRSVFNV